MIARTRSIRANALFAFALTLGAGSVVLVLTLRGFLLEGYLRGESEQMHGEFARVAAQISFLLEDLGEYAASYAASNETWDFLGGRIPGFFTENFTFAPKAIKKFSLVAILDIQGRLVAGMTFNAASQTYAPLPPAFFDALRLHPELRAHTAPQDRLTGLFALDGRPLLLASRPIARNNLTGPIRGTILIGEEIDERLLRRLGSPVGDPLHVYATDEPNLPAEVRTAVDALRAGAPVFIARPNRRRLSGYSLLADFTGERIFVLRLDQERSVYANGLMSLNILLVALGTVLALTGGAYVLLLERTVLRRVIRLGESVRLVGEGTAAADGIIVDGADEIGALAEQVRGALIAEKRLAGALEEAAHALERRVEERTRDLRQTVDALSVEIAERRRAEELVRDMESRQRAVIENMLGGLVTFDERLEITGINPAAQRLLRLTPSCLGHPLAQTLPEAFARDVADAFLGGEPSVNRRELSLRFADGQELVFGYVLSRIPAAAGRGGQGIVVFRDLTDERRLVAEQQRLNRLTLLGEFSAQVAHELRNPLTAMSSTVQYLSAASGGRDAELVRVILESIERMDEIIRRMRLLSREMPLARTTIDLGDLLVHLLRFLEASSRAQGVTVAFRPPDGPVFITGDLAQLHQALLNLLMNALQAMPHGGRLRLRLVRGRPAGATLAPVLLLIADSGVGIPPAIAGRIFDPFYTTRETGTGLGLPIADKIVREHGGSIRFTSRPGHGACFTVILPGATPEGGTCPVS